MTKLFIVETGDGEPIDVYGEGGYSVWEVLSEAEAALSRAQDDEPDGVFTIVEFRRHG